MRRFLFILLFIPAVLVASGQYKVRFIVKDITAIKRDSIYIAGTFNNWNTAADNRYKLDTYSPYDKSIVLNLPGGHYEYKYHGGGWLKIEKDWDGSDLLNNRRIDVRRDTVVYDEISEWRDLVFKNKQLAIARAKDDTTKIKVLISITEAYGFNADETNTDSALHYINQAMQLLDNIQSQNKFRQWPGFKESLMAASADKSSLLRSFGDYPQALELHFRVLQIAQENKDSFNIAATLLNIAVDYSAMKDYSNGLEYCRKAWVLYSNIKKPFDPMFKRSERWLFGRLAHIYNDLNMPDSTLYFARRMFEVGTRDYDERALAGASHLLGDNYAARRLFDSAFYFYRFSLTHALNSKMVHSIILSQKGLAEVFKEKGQIDSALYYARAALLIIENIPNLIRAGSENPESYLADLSALLADIYKIKKQPDSAYKYLQLSVDLKDSLFNANKQKQLQTLTFTESIKRQQQEQKERQVKQKFETQLKMYGLVGGMVVLLLFAIVLFRNNRQKQKSNTILQSQKKEVEVTLTELRNTQAQLIQSEKMASLGELTAGIAHEIQNPLNFVNNFSEVNKELIEELKSQKSLFAGQAGKLKNAELDQLLDDIAANEEKINHHGKRADAIVKGMLQHSRKDAGEKEATDINALADEYLRLSFHGMRGKDKSFNADFKTDLDDSLSAGKEGIGKINIVPQDIGRVLLNLYNNAFYAVNEKKRSADENYKPTVSVITKKLNDKVEIRITDNGNGIPQNLADKIFQPFFTTKPTGQGTGLGLSLSYDIVKAHGGELKVETKEREGSTFITSLPLI